MDLVAGSRVAERFRLVRKLGEGGMGVVWSAIDERNHATVAMKFLRSDALAEPESLRRFHREAKTAMRLHHPNIVRMLEVVKLDGGAPAMVMDLLEGESLAARLTRERTLSVPEFARIFLQILSAVGSAHAAGIVHRDLKPDNVFLVRSASDVGGEPQEHDVRVLDFGIAKLRPAEGESATTALTGTGAMLGTPYYMAPEQVFGERDLDHRADVWALGVIMYECLSGRRPFAGDNFGQVFKAITRGDLVPLSIVASRLPRDLIQTCERMLAIERDARLSDLREVFEVVRTYTEVDAQLFSAPTLPAGSNRDDYADALAPTLAADTGAAVARGRTMSRFPPPETPRRWPLVAGGAALLAAGLIAVVTRNVAVQPAAAPSATTPADVAPAATAVLSATPSASASPSAPPSVSVTVAPSAKQAPHPKPTASALPALPVATTPPTTPPPPATAPTAPLAGGVAPKPPF